MIIEWNAHMFSSDTERYPFHPRASYKPKPDKRFPDPLSEYIIRMENQDIDRAVLVHPEPYGDDHRLALDCVNRYPTLFKTTALFYPKDEDACTKLKDLVVENPEIIVAFRFHAHEGKRTYLNGFDDLMVRKLWRTAGELGLIIELHIGPDYALQAGKLAKEFREFPVLIDHMGEAKYSSGPDFVDVIKMSELDNVYMKLSGLGHYADDAPLYQSVIPFSKWIADAFGPDRMVWGGETHRIVDVHLSHWNESDRAKVKGRNLLRLLKF